MAAPELRLEVSLNLAGFRNEVRRLTQVAQSEFNPVLTVKVDTRDFRAQLKALERIKPVIKIEDSQLDAARARIGALNKSLVTLRRATSTPIEIKLKYTEIGKPPSAAAGQIGQAVSGKIRADQAVASLNREQAIAARNMLKEANVPVSGLGKSRSLEAYRKSIIDGMASAGKESIAGLAQGLKDGQSAVGRAAKTVGEEGIRAIKDTLGIASPSKVFRQIGEFSVDGLEAGFLNGLKDFKSKSVAEIRKIVALMRFELAKVSDLSGTGGPSVGSLRQKLVGQRAYTSPIGPQPIGSRTPWAAGSAGQFGASGYEPRMVSRPYGQAYPAAPGSFLQFSRGVGQASQGGSPPSGRTPGSFAAFSQRATQITQASRGGRGSAPPPSPPRPPSGGGGGGGAFGGMQFNMPQLPGSGVVQELGQEFGFAAKQVLLFGTAYKALAFLQGFPAQVGAAVGALQSFRNTLGAISPSATEAAASSQFILDIVDKYNTPLQSARDGFTKLYASMQPAGFSGSEIRDLFLGINQAAATFGMSADKVDRVNYAFAQMASKGQVMSEELKGQLGDVLPGAMAIFAEAAGFKGPEAITKFSKALEDGAYKGGAMKTLLTNVGAIMRQEFGPGAEGAARTFQGVMNRMQNSLTLLYETFEPVAVGFLNSVVTPMTSGLKTITDGFNAFFTGVATKTAGGFAIAQELEKLRPTFDGLRTNAIALAQVFGEFAKVALSVGNVLLQIAGNPIVGFMAKIYAIIVPLNMALGVMRGLWALNSLQLLLFNARVATGVPMLSAFRGMMQATGATAAVTASSIRTAGLTLRTFFASTGVGLVLVGISLLIERFMSMNQALADTRAKALGAADAIRSMSKTEAIAEERKTVRAIKLIETLQARKRSYEGSTDVPLTESEASLLEGVGVPIRKGLGGGRYTDPTMLEGYRQRLETVNLAESKNRQTALDSADREAQQSANIAPIAPGGGDATGGGKPPKEKSLESYYGLQDTLAKNAADFVAAQTEEEFRHKIELLELYYDIQETRANAYQKDAVKFEREMVMIEAKRQEARLNAQLEVQRAQESVAGGVETNQGNLTSFTSQQLAKATQEASQFTGVANMCSESVKAFYKSLGISLPGVTAWADTVRNAGQTMTDWSKLQAGDIVATGRPGDTPHVGVYTGGQNVFHQSRKRGLKAGNYPDLSYFKQQGYFVRPGSAIDKPQPIPASQKRDAVAEQKTLQASIAKTATERMADARAVQEQIVAFERYRATAFPTSEQATQNKLLAKRNELFRSGMTDERIDEEIKLYENQERGAAGLAVINNLLKGKIITEAKAAELIRELNEAVATQNGLLKENATAMAQSKFDQTMGGIRDQIAMARSFTPEQEMRTQIAQEGFAGEDAEAVFQERKTLQEAQKLKEDMQGIASSISESFGTAFKGVVTGSMTAQEALAGFFETVANSFADMVTKMIAEWLKAQLIKGFMSLIPSLGGGFGTAGASGPFAGVADSLIASPFANGGIAPRGFKAFADGGIVNGPTLGLVGEGKYNEAIIPLPDGRNVPVKMQGEQSSRELLSSMAAQQKPPSLNLSFQTTTIGGVEYVSRDQLEQAMSETRRMAARDGASRGASMAIDRIANNPSDRRRAGIR